MPEIIDRRISFNGGELSPWLDPRIDLDKYRSGCRTLENMLPAIYGGAMRRPGTTYLGAAPASSGKIRLVPFVASVSTTYILEFSALKLRIWTTGATPALVVIPTGTVGEIATITVTSTASLDEKTIVLYDSNNQSVGFWLDTNSSGTAPAAALACATQVRVPVTASSLTSAADGIADGINAHPDFMAKNAVAVVTVESIVAGARTDGSVDTASLTFLVTQQGVTTTSSEIVTPYLEADLDQLQFSQQNDVIFIAHPDHFPRELARYSATDWRIGPLQVFWPAALEENTSETTIDVAPITTTGETAAAAWSPSTSYTTLGGKVAHSSKTWALKAACLSVEPGSGTLAERHWMETHGASPTTDQCYGIGQKVTLAASTAAFASTDIGSKWVVIHKRDDLKTELLLYGAAAGALSPAIFVLGEWSAMTTATSNGSGDWSVNVLIQRSLDNITWETRNVITTHIGEIQKLITGFEKDPCFLRVQLEGLTATGGLPGYLRGSIVAGDPNAYSIYEIIAYASTTSVTALVYFPPWKDYTATKHWSAPAWNETHGFPRAVTLHQGRLFFGGNGIKPTTFWGSEVDGYTNFRVAATDDAAVSYTLNSDEASAVEWLVSQDNLVIGTASGEWVFGAKTGETTEKLRRNTSYGSLPVQARTIADALVFIQRSGRKMREFAWSFERDGYNSVDLSMLAEHIGDSLFLQMAIQRNADPIVWVVNAAGDLLSLTYERSQKVAAWAVHTTDGDFESVAVVPGAGEDDQVWVAVERTVNGVTSRFIERITPDVVRMLKSGANTTLVYSDCSKTTTSNGSGLVSGLTHLVGKSVSLLVDGKVHAPVTVSGGGTVQLAANAANYSKTVVAGLPYDSLLEPTYLETMDPNSITLAGKKRLHRAVLEFWKSGAVNVSTDGGTTYKPITFDTGVTLMTGPLEMYLDGSSGRQVTAIFKQSDPLPFNLMGVILRYNVEMG